MEITHSEDSRAAGLNHHLSRGRDILPPCPHGDDPLRTTRMDSA